MAAKATKIAIVFGIVFAAGCARKPPPPHGLQDAQEASAAASAGLKASLPNSEPAKAPSQN
jgi:PBP1b-binding outer membrane lipoprotein LpoB